jgi:ribosomal protein S4
VGLFFARYDPDRSLNKSRRRTTDLAAARESSRAGGPHWVISNQADVDRYRARRVRDGAADEQELMEALERAHELHGRLAELVKRLERRLDARAARPR